MNQFLTNSYTANKLAELKHGEDLARAQRWRRARVVSRQGEVDRTPAKPLRPRVVFALFHPSGLGRS
ncbi:MAG: hypothetical protein HOV67_31195 [Kribbellaceae bacterium]|nr:hypothetical protein [Kribbellaceae bacterium]